MKYSHWELLLNIYQSTNEEYNSLPLVWQCNKNLMKTCIKNEWVKIIDDKYVIVSNKGFEDAKTIAELHKKDRSQIGQTY